MRVGIDFGTTRTVVAYADRGNYPVLSFLDESGQATDWFPSVVAERHGELRFGPDALAASAEPGWTLVRSFKRWLSDPAVYPDQRVRVGDVVLPIAELLTRFFLALREAILHHSNLPRALAGDATIEAVVAAPANALGAQRFVTLEAFRRAGFSVRAMLNEPSAAGFEYTHRFRRTLSPRRELVVVYDLGGGTFDASLVRMSGAAHEALATGGLPTLGGDDFDDVLAGLALDAAGAASISDRGRVRLCEICREAKEHLGPQTKRIPLELDALGEDLPPETPAEVTVDARAYYEACAPLVRRTLDAMSEVVDLAGDGLAGIYVVGGASGLPVVGRLLRERFGRRVHVSPYPSAATAVGLAIASDTDAGLELSDRFSRTFGVFREASEGHRITFDPIFTRDTPLPAPGGEPIVIERVYRAAHNIGHYRFVECATVDGEGAPAGTIAPTLDVLFPFDPDLAAADLRGVPVRRLGKGPIVRERYELDDTGLVRLRIADVERGVERDYCIGASP